MNPLAELLHRTASATLPPLAAHLWSSTLFLILVLLALAAFRRRLTASARFALAFIGLAKFAIPAALFTPAIDRLFPDSRVVLPIPLSLAGGGITFEAAPAATSVWPSIAVAVWLAVALALFVRFALTRHRLVALSTRTALPPHPREVAALTRARRRVGVRRSIDIARSALPEAPAVLRILRPLVVLPAEGCDELSDEELESLLCHECAHVARHDNLIARIESLLSALFWFHPLIWIAQRITVLERERACDEVVADSADERETYLTALTKFCHAAIAPRQPGVSCMATAKLKERMDYVMNYPTLKTKAPSSRRLTLLAAAALAIFTLGTALVVEERAFAGTEEHPYAIRLSATRAGSSITLEGSVSENPSGTLLVAPRLTFAEGQPARSTSSASGVEISFDVRPDGDAIAVDVAIRRDGKLIDDHHARIVPSAAAEAPEKYSGAPISLSLKDADLRDVIGTFGKITGLEMKMDDSVNGVVSVDWKNVPWDQAFDSLVKQNGLTYRIEGSTIEISKK